jgi:hypothetical protein
LPDVEGQAEEGRGVSLDEQRRRFEARIKDPMRHWKLSPMDTESVRRWDYTAAYQRMIKATHTSWAPWYIVPAAVGMASLTLTGPGVDVRARPDPEVSANEALDALAAGNRNPPSI